MANRKLGIKIEKKLKEQGISQKEFAEMIGVTQATMSRYITGLREPNLETLNKISEALGTTIDDLAGKNDNVEPNDYSTIKRLIARNAHKMTKEQRNKIINDLLKY